MFFIALWLGLAFLFLFFCYFEFLQIFSNLIFFLNKLKFSKIIAWHSYIRVQENRSWVNVMGCISHVFQASTAMQNTTWFHMSIDYSAMLFYWWTIALGKKKNNLHSKVCITMSSAKHGVGMCLIIQFFIFSQIFAKTISTWKLMELWMTVS